MYKLKLKEIAQHMAKYEKLSYGLCVLDGFYYVGTIEQLNKIGCIDIEHYNKI